VGGGVVVGGEVAIVEGVGLGETSITIDYEVEELGLNYKWQSGFFKAASFLVGEGNYAPLYST